MAPGVSVFIAGVELRLGLLIVIDPHPHDARCVHLFITPRPPHFYHRVPSRTNMPRRPNSTNGRVSKASEKAPQLNASNVTALEHELDAPNDQVQKNTRPKAGGAAARTLDEEQEKLLIEWIRRVKALYSVPTAVQITTSANQILSLNGTDKTISKAWVDRLVKGLPDDLKPTKKRFSRKKCLDASDREPLGKLLDRLAPLIAQISPANVYNCGETIFQIGLGNGPQWIFAKSEEEAARFSPERAYIDWVTTIDCIAADG